MMGMYCALSFFKNYMYELKNWKHSDVTESFGGRLSVLQFLMLS